MTSAEKHTLRRRKAEPVEYESIKMKYLKFGTVATKKLKTDFKNNAGFMDAVKKITS